MNVKVWLLVAPALLAGCAQYQNAQYQKAMKLSAQNMGEVCRMAVNDPAIDPIRAKVVPVNDRMTVEQLSDTTYPTAADKSAISALDKAHSTCVDAAGDYMRQYAPFAIPAFTKRSEVERSLIAHLYAGTITYGDFDTQRQKAASDFKAEAYAAQSAYQDQQRQIAAQEMRARAAAFSAIHPYTPPPLYMPPMQTHRPVTTQCSRFGASINCTSY